MEYIEACEAAKKYYIENTNMTTLSGASEDDNNWYFNGGEKGKIRIGSTIIAVSKKDGAISVVDRLSDEGFDLLLKSKKIELPEGY